jgi:gliding motility-associated-like protein
VKKFIFLCVLFVSIIQIYATHNRAGEISYKHVAGLTYEFTVTIFADPSSIAISRREIEINWGDNTGADSITNIFPDTIVVPGKIIRRRWIAQHTFPGPGNYSISVSDRNRNGGVENISNSSSVPFYLVSKLRIFPVDNIFNDSPRLLNDPIDDACVGSRFVHNPGAIDPDGDSLVYLMTESLGINGSIAPGFTFPPSSGRLEMNRFTGDLVWENPTLPGIYNIAMKIIEYRNGLYLGEIHRDIQIEVYSGCNNKPPTISLNPYICFEAERTVTSTIQGFDQDVQDKVSLTFTGEIFQSNIVSNTAIIVDGLIGNPITSQIIWNTNCNDIRESPYTYSIKATDDANSRTSSIPNLTSFSTGSLRVVGPAVKNVLANPFGKKIVLNWQASICNNATGYKLYRRRDSANFVPTSCQIGVPASTEYKLIETILNPNTTTYTDDNFGRGLVPGQLYCYLITATFNDNEEGYASIEFCAEVEKFIPVITKVDVINTSENFGQIDLSWSPPSNVDSTAFPPPYKYLVYQNDALIDSTPTFADTNLLVQDLNTLSNQFSFQVEYLSLGNGRQSVGFSNYANSIFLNTAAIDNGVELSWVVNAPWNNRNFIIYRSIGNINSFDSIGITQSHAYVDVGINNGVEYCYYVESEGEYNLTTVISPIINKSQISCATPLDIEPPCSPEFGVKSNCVNEELELDWNNPNISCGGTPDAIGYNIYYSKTRTGKLELLQTINSIDVLQFDVQLESIAGCYLVTAIDSADNESVNTESVCVDYCPFYELPNIFTPNGDGKNDLFVPMNYPNYRHVESIDMKIFSRWGEKVFETKNPDILWDGSHQFIGEGLPALNGFLGNDNEKVSAGVYFYSCIVNQVSLDGIEQRILKGSITVIDPEINITK